VVASDDPRDIRVLISLVEGKYGFVTNQALELLAARPDPSAIEALERFSAGDNRFDLVWLARHALSVIRGDAPSGIPTDSTRSRAYGPNVVYESLTWDHRNTNDFPAARGDELVVIVMPSFHVEMLVTIGPTDARVWIGHESIWRSINSGSGFPSGSRVSVLTTDSGELAELTQLASDGFDHPRGLGLDGVQFGRIRYGNTEQVETASWQNPRLIEFLALVRSLGLARSQHFMEFEAFENLGGYVDVELEVSQTDFPLRAVRLSGRCSENSWVEFERQYNVAQLDVVDVSALGFLAPSMKPAFANWVERTGAVLVTEEENPYARKSLAEKTFGSWHEAGDALAARPVLQSVGYWTTGPDSQDGLPHPSTFVDQNADPEALAEIADLLDNGVTYVYAMGLSPCRICGQHNGAGENTNGVLTWPTGLSHYVRDHSVVLPAAITDLLRAHPLKPEARWLTMFAAEAASISQDLWRSVTNPE
jgi:hypothetical protein